MLFTNWIVLCAISIAWLLYYAPWCRSRQLILLVVLSLGIYGLEAPGVLALLLAAAISNAWAAYRVARAQNAQSALSPPGLLITVVMIYFVFVN